MTRQTTIWSRCTLCPKSVRTVSAFFQANLTTWFLHSSANGFKASSILFDSLHPNNAIHECHTIIWLYILIYFTTPYSAMPHHSKPVQFFVAKFFVVIYCFVKIYWTFISFFISTHFCHFFPISIHFLQCIHCLLQLYVPRCFKSLGATEFQLQAEIRKHEILTSFAWRNI